MNENLQHLEWMHSSQHDYLCVTLDCTSAHAVAWILEVWRRS
jgi:hypothetical protein